MYNKISDNVGRTSGRSDEPDPVQGLTFGSKKKKSDDFFFASSKYFNRKTAPKCQICQKKGSLEYFLLSVRIIYRLGDLDLKNVTTSIKDLT